jgi:hypothetical protein
MACHRQRNEKIDGEAGYTWGQRQRGQPSSAEMARGQPSIWIPRPATERAEPMACRQRQNEKIGREAGHARGQPLRGQPSSMEATRGQPRCTNEERGGPRANERLSTGCECAGRPAIESGGQPRCFGGGPRSHQAISVTAETPAILIVASQS